MTRSQIEQREADGIPWKLRRVGDDHEQRPYDLFDIRPLSPTIGAEIEGVDLHQPIDAELHGDLRRAFLEWKVLFYRNQELSTDQNLAFGRSWGMLTPHPFLPPGPIPELTALVKGVDKHGEENLWHADDAWMECPSSISILRALKVPDVGGDTVFADMAAAYDDLPEATKERLEGLQAQNQHAVFWSGHKYAGQTMSEEQLELLRRRFPPQIHPVIRTHPETGRKSLFVDLLHPSHIIGLDPDESEELLDNLVKRASWPEYQCRFHWRANSIAMWDNRTVQHYAVSDYWPNERRMERMVVAGDRPC